MISGFAGRRIRRSLLVTVLLAAVLGLGQEAAVAEANGWNVLGSPGFTQVFVRTECPGQAACQNDVFSTTDNSFAYCFGSGPSPCVVNAYSSVGWSVGGLAGLVAVDHIDGTFTGLVGERVSARGFLVDGFVDLTLGLSGTVEVAVLRFSGEPTVFEGVEAASVYDLVSLGLIGNADVLAVTTVAVQGPIALEADVNGLADHEILLFAAATGEMPGVFPGFIGLASESFSYCFARNRSFILTDDPLTGGYYQNCEDSEFAMGGCTAALRHGGGRERSHRCDRVGGGRLDGLAPGRRLFRLHSGSGPIDTDRNVRAQWDAVPERPLGLPPDCGLPFLR